MPQAERALGCERGSRRTRLLPLRQPRPADVIALATKVFLTLFVLLDPVGLAPLFLGLTANRTPEERKRIARRAVALAGGLLLLFALADRKSVV